MEDLKKASPPPLPANALKTPTAAQRAEHVENDSPWDVVSSAPAPTSPKLNLPTWLGRPVVAPEHMQELEQAAAIHEFGHKMPRQQAEMKAYNDYVRKQRVSASAHHLAGMKAANAAGDHEAARKHGMMYKLHSEALGHNAVGPAHPDVVAASASPQKVYRFKAHKGDSFAFAGEHGGPHEMGLHKALKSLYDGAVELTKSEKPTHYQTGRGKILGDYEAACGSKHQQGGMMRTSWEHVTCKKCLKNKPAEEKKEDLAKSAKDRGGERGGAKNKEREIYETHEREHGDEKAKDESYQEHDLASPEPGEYPVDFSKKEKSPEDKEKSKKLRTALASKTTCPVEGCGKYKPHWANVCVDCHRQGYALGKSDMEIKQVRNNCTCEHYKFPHRRGGGKCKSR